MQMKDFSAHGFLRVAAATPQVSIGDPHSNAENMLSQIKLLAEQQVAVAVLPELSLSGYSAEDLFFTDKLLLSLIHISEPTRPY